MDNVDNVKVEIGAIRPTLQNSHEIQGATKRLYVDKEGRVVRFAPLRFAYKEIGHYGISPEEGAKIGMKLYEELRDKYNINVPVAFSVGTWKTRVRGVCTRVEHIKGSNIKNEYFGGLGVEGEQKVAEKLDIFYCSLVNYLLDKFKAGDYFLWDIFRNEQYVYGIKQDKILDEKREQEKDIYLVDVDVFAFRNAKESPSMLLAALDNLERDYQNTARRLSAGFPKTTKLMRQVRELVRMSQNT